jgi:RNA polymerase sigma-32 factor
MPVQAIANPGRPAAVVVKFAPHLRYLSEISNWLLLTREYGVRVKEQGDKDAAYALVTANLRLVVKIALEFQRVWMQNLLDLIQEGNIGLMQAVKKFAPTRTLSSPTMRPSGSRPTS